MMHTTENPRKPAIQNTIVTGSLDDQPQQLAATIAFAIRFARDGGAPLALNAAQSHRSQLLALLAPATVESLTAGETVNIDSGPTLDLIDDQAVVNFVGLVLFVGIDAARLALLKAPRESMVIAVPQTNEERAAVLDAFPDAGRLELRPEPEADPLPEMTQSHAFKLQWLEQRYDVIAAALAATRPRSFLAQANPRSAGTAASPPRMWPLTTSRTPFPNKSATSG